jgi:hypothetical protein
MVASCAYHAHNGTIFKFQSSAYLKCAFATDFALFLVRDIRLRLGLAVVRALGYGDLRGATISPTEYLSDGLYCSVFVPPS